MGALVVCLSKAITKATVEGIARLREELEPEMEMRVVFKDSGLKGDVDKTNAMQLLRRRGIKEENIRSL
jgi:adenine-specific DNA-methyltransferase